MLRAPSLNFYPMPPRTTQKSNRPRVSNRIMVGTFQPVRLFSFRNRPAPSRRKMKLLGWRSHVASPLRATSRARGTRGQHKPSRNRKGLDVEAKTLLTSGQRRNIPLDIPSYRILGRVMFMLHGKTLLESLPLWHSDGRRPARACPV